MLGERGDDGSDQTPPTRAVSVHIGVVDGELRPQRSLRRRRDPEQGSELVPRKAVRERIIDGPHDRWIQHINIHVDPVARRPSLASQVIDCLLHGRIRAESPNLTPVEHQEVRGQRLAAMPNLCGCATVSEEHDVVVADERATVFEVGDDAGPTPRREGKIARGRRPADRVRLGLVKIGVPIDVEESGSTTSLQRQHCAEENRTVTSRTMGNSPTSNTSSTESASAIEYS
jgi:hypothetical protein